MAIERCDVDDRQERIDRMIEEFRSARQRRLVKIGKALWNRTATEQRKAARVTPSPLKVN